MNERERYKKTLLFEKVDKIPFSPGSPRESTLKRWHKEGLPENVNWFEYICEKIGIKIEKPKKTKINLSYSFFLNPLFEEKVIEKKNGHLIVQTEKGEIVEIDEKYDFTYLRSAKDFVTRKWHKFPVENLSDWEDMKKRYNPESPERIDPEIDKKAEILKERDWVLGISFHGPFWQLREWCGFENLCIFMAEKEDFVLEMANFWKNFVSEILKKLILKVQFDYAVINEDMAYKEKSMISPSMIKKYLMPCWVEWTSLLKKSGCEVVMVDSDGYIEEIIPIWIESGINCTIPVEIAAGNDPVKFRKKFGKNMAYVGGIDKRKIAKGGDVLKKEMDRIIPFLFKDGGYIPSCDHGVPPDISFENFIEYCKYLAKYTGYL
ncbi:MAG TPA: uroporphyrinogen decarboxylase family protein [bacterium]|nr:uroporphyrinogen decarboxylase family protein [bacterium]HOM26458.1 uroporphyrinogen decarboxylase family protein [bacterium]